MQYFKNLSRRTIRSLPVILLTLLAIYFYLSHVSPYSSSGTIDIFHLVIIAILASTIFFFIYHIFNPNIPKSLINTVTFIVLLILRVYHFIPIWLAIIIYVLSSIAFIGIKKKHTSDDPNIKIEFGQTPKDNV